MILNLSMKKCVRWGMMLFFVVLAGYTTQAIGNAAQLDAKTGVLVITADRGFLGNQEIGDGFDQFAAGRNADILYVVDVRSKSVLNEKLSGLVGKGAGKIIVLPLFISTADARWQMVQPWLEEHENLLIAKPYGSSYLAVEDLSDRLRDVHTEKKSLLLVGYGAADAQAAQQMKSELTQMAEFASVLTEEDIQVAIYPAKSASDNTLQQQYDAALKNSNDTLVVPVLLAHRADSMMSFDSSLPRRVSKEAQLVTSQFSTANGLQQWMAYATNEVLLQSPNVDSTDIGTIALAHGSDWFWNQAIRDSLVPVAKKSPLVFTFSMADQPTIERAVQDLEKKPVHGIVLVRIFGQASSFRPTVERMIGADVQNGQHSGHDHSMGHGDHGGHVGMMMSHGDHAAMSTLAASPRIRTSLPIVTVGGVEDSPYFAKSLLANARSISVDPPRETIILTAHGAGADADNEQWYQLLESLASQMKNEEGYNFKDIRYVTWREDWPEKSKPELAKARKWVSEINKTGGRVLIVPARTNGRGAANVYLKGLNFGWSQGFAQTPYLSRWFEDQIMLGISQLTGEKQTSKSSPEGHHMH